MSFVVSNTSLFILERKGISEHLSKIENLDTAVTLQSLVCDLQDAGEVTYLLLNHWGAYSQYMFCCRYDTTIQLSMSTYIKHTFGSLTCLSSPK